MIFVDGILNGDLFGWEIDFVIFICLRFVRFEYLVLVDGLWMRYCWIWGLFGF